jgi:hypothetical protein
MMYQMYHTNIPFPNECDEMPENCDGIIFSLFNKLWVSVREPRTEATDTCLISVGTRTKALDTNRGERFQSVKTRTEG